MYTKTIPVKDLKGNPHNITIHLMLDERGVFKNLVELQFLMGWREKMEGPLRDVPTEDVVEFYNNLEAVILAAYGVPSEDGMHFDRNDRYKFEDSVTFNALMMMFLSDPQEANKLVDAIIPKGLSDWVKTADANMAKMASEGNVSEDQAAEIERLRKQLAEAQGQTASN